VGCENKSKNLLTFQQVGAILLSVDKSTSIDVPEIKKGENQKWQ